MTDYLYASPSFLEEIGRCMDIGATFDNYNSSDSTDKADYNAVLSDVMTIGKDMSLCLNSYEA